MSNHENETCGGCVVYKEGCRRGDYTVMAHDKICDVFTPSLECRKVRALEKLNSTLVTLFDGCIGPSVELDEESLRALKGIEMNTRPT